MLPRLIAASALALSVFSLSGCATTGQDTVARQLATGDGLTPATAYRVDSVRQEYAIVAALGYEPKSQALSDYEGRPYDIMTVTDIETGNEMRLWFDIGSFFGRY